MFSKLVSWLPLKYVDNVALGKDDTYKTWKIKAEKFSNDDIFHWVTPASGSIVTLVEPEAELEESEELKELMESE